jgi:hypothetical protein
VTNEEGLSNPYDPQAIDYAPETPSLGSVLQYALHQHSLHMRVALPCQIVAVHGNQLVDVQPLLMSRYTVTDRATPLPVLVNTLVAMPSGGDYGLRYPIAVGDLGYCIFCDRSLDVWASGSGAQVDPQDSRSHDLTDGVFYPGLVPTNAQTQDTTSDLTLTNGAAQIRLEKTGRFVVKNNGQELFNLLDEAMANLGNLLTSLQQAVIMTPVGPGSFAAVTQSQLASVQQTAAAIRANLSTLKG